MSTLVAPPAYLDDAVAEHHDYVWARLPFVVPMAIAAARRRGDRTTRELARLLVELAPLLLGHLDREETLLAHRAAVSVGMRIRAGIYADHVAVIALIDRIRAVAGTEYEVRTGAHPTERALFLELARLDMHVQTQITLEEQLMEWGQGAA
jgi:iron-sulfur cluster repair protein YtfE (RIC family)